MFFNAVVTFTGCVPSEDVIALPSRPAGLSVSFANCDLVMNGFFTVEEYQAIARRVTYENTSSHPTTTPRRVFFSFSEGLEGARSGSGSFDLVVRGAPQ